MNLELAQLGMVVEEFDQVDLWEGLKRIKIATKLDLHDKVLHLACTLEYGADGIPAPLNSSKRHEL